MNLIETDLQPALKASYMICWLLFSVAGWTDLKLGMKRSSIKRMGKMYLETNLKENKATRLQLEARADAQGNDMKEGDVFDETELSVF